MAIFMQIFKMIVILAAPIYIPMIILFILTLKELTVLKVFKKMKRVKFTGKIEKISFFKRLFIEFPKRFALDYFERDPNHFNEYGVHVFVGEQGSGKTTAVVHKLLQLQKRFPQLIVRTNMDYKYQDAELNHWKDLVQNNNGEFGQVEVIDEIQTWFNSNQSKNFPVEMLTEVSQQRKQRKMIIGTSQLFNRMAKPLREQVNFVHCPMTLFGCLTIVRVTKPKFWNDEKQIFTRFIKTYFFVHTEEIRNAFDTYQKIERYSDGGFQINPQLHPQNQN